MSDELEKKIAAQSKEPRVSEQDVMDNIRSVYFYTARQGLGGLADADVPDAEALSIYTHCVIVAKNGFICTGESACASPANYNKEIGETIAKRNAVSKLWGFLGYALRDKLYNDQLLTEQAVVAPHDGLEAYTGTKRVLAAPLTRAQYNTLRGWELPKDENGDDEGYLVEYTDKLDGQVEGFPGYVSWSPKDVFERAYTNKEPEKDFKDRLVVERAQLNQKVLTLQQFLSGDTSSLDQTDVNLLRAQQAYMKGYLDVLDQRMVNLGL